MATSKTSKASTSTAKTGVATHNHSDLEARIAKLEAAVKKNEEEILNCATRCLSLSEDLKASCEATSGGGNDPRVSELQAKLRQLVQRLSQTRGNLPDWPSF